MYIATNKFGERTLYEAEDIKGKIYALCTACMSIYAEFLSWANANPDRITTDPAEADSIVVLSCQVTDLAVLNDLKYLESLRLKYPGKEFYVGGCLARRFDIPVPAKRLDNVKSDYQRIVKSSLVDWAPPFWVKNFKEGTGDGNLFRHFYPLRIGVGCNKKCKYCSINTTRGAAYELYHNNLLSDFASTTNDVVLIADSPNFGQIKAWSLIAETHNKPISIRNLEPQVAVKAYCFLGSLAMRGLLKILHVPIQSDRIEVLEHMGRDVISTMRFLDELNIYSNNGVHLATNIIIDYLDFANPSDLSMFDSFSWNPYWDGKWDRQVAESRWTKYIDSRIKL